MSCEPRLGEMTIAGLLERLEHYPGIECVERGIEFVDLFLRDERALEILRASFNPETKRCDITLKELSARLHCSINTATAITNRLAGAGYIAKHQPHGSSGAQIEVLVEGARSQGG